MLFRRMSEPNESAFSVLVPEGWQLDGGIFRLGPTEAGGAGNAIAAKCDLTIRSNDRNTVMVRFLPDMLYMDMRNAPAAAFFPPGSNYNGMPVSPKMSPGDYILQVLVPWLHPGAEGLRVVDSRMLDDVAEVYRQGSRAMAPMSTMDYAAALVVLEYSDAGTLYREMVVSVVEDYGSMGAGLWGNRDTFLFSAPASDCERWWPVLSAIHRSLRFDRNWLVREIKGQQTRATVMDRTLQQMQDIDRQITDHRRKINAEIHNDMFLTLMEQEEYVNPFTGEAEMGSNQWRHRWVTEQGDVLYTDDETYDPNTDIDLHVKGFKRTPARPRYGQ